MNRSSARKTILLVERDNWQKDNALNRVLVQYLKTTKHRVVWEDPAGHILYKVRCFENKMNWLPSAVKQANLRVIQVLFALTHWNYFSYLLVRSNDLIELRCKRLKKALLKLNNKNELIILARSVGARAATLIADEFNIKHIICIGYPFKHPQKDAEPARYLHLSHLKTPLLIIQGKRDEYGGSEIKDYYALGKNIELYLADADHDFRLNENDWQKVLLKIGEIIDR